MEGRENSCIASNLVLLTKDMNINDEFMAILRQRYTLTYSVIEEMEAEKNRVERNSIFLRHVRTRGPQAFSDFIIALMETDQEHLAMALSPELVEQWREANPNKISSPGPLEWPPRGKGMQSPNVTLMSPRRNFATHRKALESPMKQINQSSTGDLGPTTEINIHKVEPSVAKKILVNPKENYKMSANPRGRVIILNNEDYFTKAEEGSNVDVNNLSQLFKTLGFTVDTWTNYSASKIKKEIFKERLHHGHKSADAFIFIVLSQGTDGAIYGIDGDPVYIASDIVERFDGKNSQNLVGKPKLFFIQACERGPITEEENGTDENYAVATTSLDTMLHEKADMLVMMSAVPGNKGWREEKLEQSWFLRDLVQYINQNAHIKDLSAILYKVSQKMKERQENEEQDTCIYSSLRKDLYFLPHYYE